ncbi:PAS domain S-box protein [Nostoc sp. FACHB-110]|uniref:PAS domain S-box protein n=1 Tax=Nostoc sp. FACHB-110 TaxID=2692834 RepID=UPI00168873BC|nr:PAS domain S-box protein [Nostoc sp. FACHB-110]MBD2439471.1 PAS domain S-box protein [Nostoc sp. FACHB-110]
MLLNSLSPDNLHLTIIRHFLTVNSKTLLVDVISLINEAQVNFHRFAVKDAICANKDIDNITDKVASCVLVIDNSQLVGIITQLDLIKLTAKGKNWDGISVAEVMTRELVTLNIEDFKDVFTALNLLRQYRICHLPIVGEQGEIIGLVTPTSLLAVTIQQAGLYNYARVKLAERQRIEAELRLERNFISAILNLTDALVVVLDSQGKIVRFNQTCEQATGHAFDEAKGKFVWDVLCLPDITECLKDIFQNLGQREFPSRYEADLINKDSDRRLIAWSSKVLLNRDDQVQYIVCTGIDITESRKTQQELQQTRNFLQSMINNLPVAVFVKDAKPENLGKFKLWNHTCERLFGITAEQAIGKTDYELFPQAQADFFQQSDKAAFTTGVTQDIAEEAIETPKFGRRILHTTKIPLYDKDKQAEYLLCISEDITEYKLAEKNLQQAKEQLQTVLDAVPGFVSWVSADGYYLGVNRHLAESFNLTADAFIGKELGFLQISPQFTTFMRNFLDRQDVADSGLVDTQINGITRKYLLIAQKYQQNTAAVAVGIDITERKQAEMALAESEAMLRSVLESTPSKVTVVNAQGTIAFINQPTPHLAFQDVVGTNIDDYVLPEDCQIQRSALERVFTHGEVVSYEIRALCTNATIRHYHSQIGPIWHDNQVTEAVIISNDISEQQAALRERKKAETALRESEQKFRLLTENIKSTFWILETKNDTYQIVYVSPAFEEIWGRRTEEVYASFDIFINSIHPSDRQQLIANQPHRFQGPYDEEYRIIRPDGSIRWIRSSAFPIKNEQGEVYRFTGIAEDITERKQTENALQSLIESTASTTGQDFFPALVEHISSTLDVRHALVTELVDGQVQTLGFWSDGQLQPNICYDPTSTPCEILYKQGYYYCASGIQQLFPTAERWVQMQAESSMGVILSDDFGNPIGSLCIIDEKLIPDSHKFEGILRVFAARASAELQRQRAQEALQKLNRDLEARVEQRTLELQESEAELRAIFNQAAVGIKLETLDGRFIKVNQKLCDILGYSQAELMNKTFWDVTHPEDVDDHQSILQKLINGDINTFSIEKRCLHKNGDFIWVNLTVSLIRDLTGTPIYSVGIVKDIRHQKQAEEELKRQFAAVEAAIDGIAILRQDTYTYVNQAHVEMFGYQHPEELIGQSWQEIYNPLEINRFQTEVFTALNHQKHWRGETIARRKDGSHFEEEVSLTISDQGDLICVCRDISQRKEAERLLEEQRSFLRSIIDNNPNYIFVKDTTGKFLLVNQAMADLHNTTIEAFVGKTDAEFYTNAEIRQFQDCEQSVLATLKPLQVLESTTNKATGEQCYFQSIKVPLIAPNGVVRGILGVATDITERKQAETELHQVKERLQFLISSSPAVIFSAKVTNNYFCPTYISENVTNLVGYPAEKFLTDYSFWLERIHPEDAAQSVKNLAQIIAAGTQSYEYRWKHQNGEYCWMFEELKLIRDEQGYPLEIIGLWMDISDRKKAEEDICKALEKEKELSELKSRFISMTSHEFRTPLAVIASSAGILKSFSHKLDEQQKQKHLQCIQTYVQHTTQLLDDILLINKAEAGKLAFDPQSLDLVSFCHTLVEEIQLSSPQHNLVFCPQSTANISADECCIACMDKKLLRQILSNLLSNAVKYSADKSNIQIELLIQNKSAVFLIHDEGIGISPQEQLHLFEPFYRASNVGNIPGTGLGLVIVNKCVDLHKGRITIASEVGVGTVVRVELPLVVTNICE